jgi:Spy/CpxP family protein refolding chaperone
MSRVRLLVLAVAMVTVASPWVVGQDRQPATETPSKMRGQLPQGWGKLGLSDEQRQKIYSVQGKYRDKIDALRKQIRDLQDQEKKDMEAVLTDAQKKTLRDNAANKAPADTKPVEKP